MRLIIIFISTKLSCTFVLHVKKDNVLVIDLSTFPTFYGKWTRQCITNMRHSIAMLSISIQSFNFVT